MAQDAKVYVVSKEQYRRILELLEASRELRARSKSPNLTLAQKIDLQRQSKHLEAVAALIGKNINSAEELVALSREGF
jgi:hypothetical protein